MRRLQVRAEIRGVEFFEQDVDAGELFPVAVGDGDFDFDGAASVADGALEAFGEGGADLAGGEHFVREGDSVERSMVF